MTLLEFIKAKKWLFLGVIAVLLVVFKVTQPAQDSTQNDVLPEIEEATKYIEVIQVLRDMNQGEIIGDQDITIKKIPEENAERLMSPIVFYKSTRTINSSVKRDQLLMRDNIYKKNDMHYLEYLYSKKNMVPFTLRFVDAGQNKSPAQIVDQINYDAAKTLREGERINIYVTELQGRENVARIIVYDAEVASVKIDGKQATLILGMKRNDVKSIFENLSKDVYIAKCITTEECKVNMEKSLSTSKIIEVRG